MATLNLRQTAAVNAGETNQNRPLTNAEVDTNFINLNTDKLEKTGGTLTGLLTLRSGAAGANGAPLRFQSGTSLTTPVSGAMEFDGTSLYFTPSGTRKTVAFTDSNITGNAATATAWATGRTLTLTGDVTGTSASFDGTGNISITTTISADATVLGTDTTGNYVASITNGSYMTGGNGGSEGAALTLAVDATSANTASKVVARDASGNFSAGTITAALSGNASTATTLQTARNIQGVSFNGSADITVISAGTGVSVSGTSVSIGQAVATTSNVSFGSILVGTGAAFPSGVVNGQIRAVHDIVAYSSSDVRLKKDVHNIPNALHKVLKLNGVLFTWDEEKKDVHGHEGQDTGIIAQNVETVLPEVVTTREDGFMAVKYEKMIGLLIEAIKELDAKVSACTCNK